MIDTSKPMQVVYRSLETFPVTGYLETNKVVAVRYKVADEEFIHDFNLSGESLDRGCNGVSRLENVPPKKVERKGWFNHYDNYSSGPYPSKEFADDAEGKYRLDCTEIDLSFYEGQGD